MKKKSLVEIIDSKLNLTCSNSISEDSIPEIIDGSLNGSLFAELQFASDTML